VRKVYGILCAQLLLTVAIACPFQLMKPEVVQRSTWILVLSSGVLLGTLISMMCFGRVLRHFPQNYAVLGLITCCMGVIVGFSSAMYSWQTVLLSAGLTVGIFLGMTVYAWKTKHDFTGLGPYMMAALLTLCMFGFLMSILALCGVHIAGLRLLYDVLGALLFTFYIVFDTQRILGGKHQHSFGIDDYCYAALALYQDIIHLFLRMLTLVGDRK